MNVSPADVVVPKRSGNAFEVVDNGKRERNGEVFNTHSSTKFLVVSMIEENEMASEFMKILRKIVGKVIKLKFQKPSTLYVSDT